LKGYEIAGSNKNFPNLGINPPLLALRQVQVRKMGQLCFYEQEKQPENTLGLSV